MAFGLIAGSLISGGLSLFGQKKAEKAQRRAIEASIAANAPRNVTSGLGSVAVGDDRSLRLSNTATQLGIMGQLAQGRAGLSPALTDPDFIGSEVERLRQLAAPRENRLRESLRSRLFSRGRLGLGIDQGNFNPELAALEEGLARADSARVDQARNIRNQDIGQFLNLVNADQALAAAPLQAANLSLGARTPSQLAMGYQALGNQQARFNEGFFGSLGGTLGPALGGLFGSGGPAAASGTSPFLQRSPASSGIGLL